MTDDKLEQRLRDWYAAEIGTTEPAPASLQHSTAAIPEIWPLPPRAVPMRSRWLLLAAAALLVSLIAGTLATGAGLVKLPAVLPLPSPSESPTPSASLPEQPATAGVVAYDDAGRIWVVNVDGTGAHELLPDVPGTLVPAAWSADGTRLLYAFARSGGLTGLGLTDATGAQPHEYDSLCPVDSSAGAVFTSCVPMLDGAALSPDGLRVAYAIEQVSEDDNALGSAIAILELGTAEVTLLESTLTTPAPNAACPDAPFLAMNHTPTWSPDGRRLIFLRDNVGPIEGDQCRPATLSVNADGSDLQPAVPDDLQGSIPQWSPDGSMFVVPGGVYASQADFRRMTAVPIPELSGDIWGWTRNGRILVIRWDTETGQLFPCRSSCDDYRGELWIMDADGGNITPLEPTIPAMTAAACVTCPYPVYEVDGDPVIDLLSVRDRPPYRPFWMTNMLWQPVPATGP